MRKTPMMMRLVYVIGALCILCQILANTMTSAVITPRKEWNRIMPGLQNKHKHRKAKNHHASCDFELVSREDWGARPPTLIEPMENPVPFVIIHHSYIPPACNTNEGCVKAMQVMQIMHQDKNGWNDIGYSFGVGGDGRAYEGRGWDRVGAHAPTYNNRSIGICLIGDWRTTLPPPNQLDAVKKLINFGVMKGYIAADYILYGHLQVRNGTECPGTALLEEIGTWDHFSEEVAEVYYPE